MRIVTLAEYVEARGGIPSLAYGRWKPWSKGGFFRLTSNKDQKHVLPRIWDEQRGLAWVEDLFGNHVLVRVENLKKDKPSGSLKTALEQVERKLNIKADKKEKASAVSEHAKLIQEYEDLLNA